MHVTLVVAAARNGVIGRDGALPWHLPADLKRFKALTLGHPILMGRRTHQSIGRALPGRLNVVVTGNRAYEAPGCVVVHDVVQALRTARDTGAERAYVIGGAGLYAAMLPYADRVELTEIDADVEGDTRIPPFEPERWREVSREAGTVDERNVLPHAFVVLQRR